VRLYEGPKQIGGTLIGAGLSALADARIRQGRDRLAAAAIGELAGVELCNEIGRSLDRADHLQLSSDAKASH
jgi:uncharacterized protein YcfJ